MKSEILIHPNTGEEIGLGHLVRCSTLARELLSRGINAELRLKRDDDGEEFVASGGIDPENSTSGEILQDIISSPADVVVIDSYEITTAEFEELSNKTTLVVIDELGDRRIPADLVVNNNVYADEISYTAASLVRRGPEYCMLREPFRNLGTVRHTQSPESILVTVGGADLSKAFAEVLTVTARVTEEATVNAVVGPYFEGPEEVPENVVFHREPSNMHELMWRADLAVSGGGQTLYELAACGTPAAALTLGTDQVRNIARFTEEGFSLDVGKPDESEFPRRLRESLKKLAHPSRRNRMAQVGQNLVDGRGAIRVADTLVELATL